MQPTAGQRLALTIVSLLILFLFFLTVIVLATTGANIAQNVAPIFHYMCFGLSAAVILVNVVFNRKH